MGELNFYTDSLTQRNFAVDAVEMLMAPFEQAQLYTLLLDKNILGPIKQRKIHTVKIDDKADRLKLHPGIIPLYTTALNLGSAAHSLVCFSQGLMSFKKQMLLYYFYDDFWEHVSQEGWLTHALTSWHQKRVLNTLRQNTNRVFCSSKAMAKRYGLDESKVIYPFFKSEDYPWVDYQGDRKALTLLLDGASLQQMQQIAALMDSDQANGVFSFVFTTEPAAMPLFAPLINRARCRLEATFCAATVQAALLQSKLCLVFPHGKSFEYALGSLASGTSICYLKQELLQEILPQGLSQCVESVEEFLQFVNKFDNISHNFSLAEARRFALRFSSRTFKERFLAEIEGCN